MNPMTKLALVLAFVATASVASLVTLLLAPNPAVHAQGLVTTKAPEKATPAGNYLISAYGYAEEPRSRKEEAKWTLGFFALNSASGKVSNCIYMWSGTPMNKCIDYAWVTLPQ